MLVVEVEVPLHQDLQQVQEEQVAVELEEKQLMVQQELLILGVEVEELDVHQVYKIIMEQPAVRESLS
jgi:hypothetical protein